MDVFDFDKTYEREVSRRALHSDFLLRCICAFTARNLSLLVSGEVWSPIASRYYGEALNHMIVALSCGEPDSDALTAAILLSSYEALAASRTSHQSHYKGALNLIITRGISASSIGLDKANFFIYLRHEITIALSNQEPLQFDPKRWNITKPGARAWEDHLVNYLMLLIGHIIRWTSGILAQGYRGPLNWYKAALRGVNDVDEAEIPDADRDFHLPTLLVVSEKDYITRADMNIAATKENTPDLRVKSFADCGHCIQLQRPDEVHQPLEEFALELVDRKDS